MRIDLLNRARLEVINRRGLRYPLAVAEKDYFLGVILKLIYASALKGSLIFKGGGALFHCYLKPVRFSYHIKTTMT